MRGIKCPQIFKNSKKPLIQRSIFAVLLLVIMLGTALIPHTANAFWGFDLKEIALDVITKIAAGALSVILGSILWAFNYIGYLALLLSTLVLKTVMSLVLGVAYTPLTAGVDSGITIGWTIVRDFANAFFILILVTIGVGTMLNLKVRGKEISANLLMPFFAVALLVNFSPLITGLLIDISNILTKFFFDAAQGGINAFVKYNPFEPKSLPPFTGTLDTAISQVFGYIIGLIFNLISSFVLLTMAMLLMARVLALWLLVIFSPLAFAAYILPMTRQYFQMWWSQFLQWTMLPVTLGFFVWLAAIFLKGAEKCGTTGALIQSDVGFGIGQGSAADPVHTLFEGNVFCEMTIYGLALGTMVVGMIVSFQSSAIGSQFIIKQAKAARGGAVSWANARRRGATAYIGREAKERVGAPVAGAVGQRLAESRLGQRRWLGAPLRTIGATLQQQPVAASEARAKRAIARYNGMTADQIRPHAIAEHDPYLSAASMAQWDKTDKESLAQAVSGGDISKSRIDALNNMAERDMSLKSLMKKASKQVPTLEKDKKKAGGTVSAKEVSDWAALVLEDGEIMEGVLGNAAFDKILTNIMKNPKQRHTFIKGLRKYLDSKGVQNISDVRQVLGKIAGGRAIDPLLNNPITAAALKAKGWPRGGIIKEKQFEQFAGRSKEKLQGYRKELTELNEQLSKQTGAFADVFESNRIKKQIEELTKYIKEEASFQRQTEEELKKYRPSSKKSSSTGGGEVEDEIEDLKKEFEEYKEEQEEKK